MKSILLTLLLALPVAADRNQKNSPEKDEITLALPEEILATITPEALNKAGFVSLFNRKDLNGWRVVGGNAKFEIVDGAIRGFGTGIDRNTFLRTKEEYSDFVFTFEFKFNHKEGNSGCMFRGLQKDGKRDGLVMGYQCEHDQKRSDGRAYTAGIFDESRRGWLDPARDAKQREQKAFSEQGTRLFKWDDWNHIVIKCEGNRLQTWLNGEKRADFIDTDKNQMTEKGFFGLQVHGGAKGDILWRNLFVKEL